MNSGLPIRGFGIDVIANRVSLLVGDISTEAAETLGARFGPAISVVTGQPEVIAATCGGQSDCGTPMKGGLVIDPSVVSTKCTSGFMGRPSNLNDDRLFVLTAGHCIDVAGGGPGLAATWHHPSSPTTFLGTTDAERYYNGTDADTATINDVELEAKNFMFGIDSNDMRRIVDHATDAEQQVNDLVCMRGRKSGHHCNVIQVRDQSLNVRSPNGAVVNLVNNLWGVSGTPVEPGDSGGPVFLRAIAGQPDTDAYGTIVAVASLSYYNTIDSISSEILARPCYSGSCGL